MSEEEKTSVSEETQPTTNEPTVKRKTKKKKIISIVLIFLVILAVLGGSVYYYFSKPSTVVTNMINKAYDEFSSMLKNSKDFDVEKDSMLMTGDLVIDTNIDGLEDLKNEKFGYTFGLDYADKKIEAGVSLEEEKTKIFDLLFYFIENNAYISLKEDYDKIIKLEDNDFDSNDVFNIQTSNISTKDMDYIAKEFKDILIDSIEMDKLKKTSDKIKIDGKVQNVSKITYRLNKENTENFMSSFIDNTLANKKLLEKLSEISNTDVEDIKDSLKDAKNEDYGDLGTLSIYTKGITNEVVKMELISDDVKFGFTINKDTTQVYVKNDENSITFEVKEYNDEKVSIDYKFDIEGVKITGKLTATSKEIKDESFEGSFSFSVSYANYDLKMTSNYTLKTNAKVADINTKDAISSDDINVEEMEKVYSDIMSRLQSSNLYDIIENVSGLFLPTSYGYGY